MASSEVVKYPENAKAYSPSPCSSRAATGIAVPTAVASKAISSTTETIPKVSARYGRDSTPPSSAALGLRPRGPAAPSRRLRHSHPASVRGKPALRPCREA